MQVARDARHVLGIGTFGKLFLIDLQAERGHSTLAQTGRRKWGTHFNNSLRYKTDTKSTTHPKSFIVCYTYTYALLFTCLFTVVRVRGRQPKPGSETAPSYSLHTRADKCMVQFHRQAELQVLCGRTLQLLWWLDLGPRLMCGNRPPRRLRFFGADTVCLPGAGPVFSWRKERKQVAEVDHSLIVRLHSAEPRRLAAPVERAQKRRHS